MIDKVNSIRKNILFDFIIGLAFLCLMIYIFQDRTTHPTDFTWVHKSSIAVYFLLVLHGLLLIALTIINFLRKKFAKAFAFLVYTVIIFCFLYFAVGFLFALSMGGPPVDDYNTQRLEATITAQDKLLSDIEQIDTLAEGSPPASKVKASQMNKAADQLILGAWTLDPDGPHADILITKDSYFLVDQEGDGSLKYTLKGDSITVHFSQQTETGKIMTLTADSMVIKWAEADPATYVRWKK